MVDEGEIRRKEEKKGKTNRDGDDGPKTCNRRHSEKCMEGKGMEGKEIGKEVEQKKGF